jgi:hypothetical protein
VEQDECYDGRWETAITLTFYGLTTTTYSRQENTEMQQRFAKAKLITNQAITGQRFHCEQKTMAVSHSAGTLKKQGQRYIVVS